MISSQGKAPQKAVFWRGLGRYAKGPPSANVEGPSHPQPGCYWAELVTNEDPQSAKLICGQSIGAGVFDDLSRILGERGSEEFALVIPVAMTASGGNTSLIEETELIAINCKLEDVLKQVRVTEVECAIPNFHPRAPFDCWLLPAPVVITWHVELECGSSMAHIDAEALVDIWRAHNQKGVMVRRMVYREYPREPVRANRAQLLVLKRPGW